MEIRNSAWSIEEPRYQTLLLRQGSISVMEKEAEGKPLTDRSFEPQVTMKEFSSSCLLDLYEIHPLRQLC